MNQFYCLSTIVAIAIGCALGATDYCKIECHGNNHIGCNNDGSFLATCPADAKIVPLTDAQNERIAFLHNTNRNKVALGTLAHLKPASRMATTVHDQDLAKIAEFNVKQCEMKHDECRNTQKCSQAGQNLFIFSSTGPLDIDSLIDTAIESWFSENEITTTADIDKYPANTSGRMIGHFTAMVRDSSISHGCAVSTFSEAEDDQVWNHFLLACDYCTTNLIDTPIYTSAAQAGSGCSTGPNKDLPGLCSINEVFAT